MHPCINHSGCEYGYRRGCGYGHGCGAKHPEVRSACTRMPSHDQKTLTHTHTHGSWIQSLREACARLARGLRKAFAMYTYTYARTHIHTRISLCIIISICICVIGGPSFRHQLARATCARFSYNSLREVVARAPCARNLRERCLQCAKLARAPCASHLREQRTQAIVDANLREQFARGGCASTLRENTCASGVCNMLSLREQLARAR